MEKNAQYAMLELMNMDFVLAVQAGNNLTFSS